MKNTLQDWLITFFGAISSLLTAVILSWMERHWNVSIYSFMVLFVIPVGAISAGLMAAGGYYIGAILCHHRPQKVILINMIAISLGTYFLIQYLGYVFLEIDGRQVSEAVSFKQYWNITTAHTAVQFRFGRGHAAVGDPVELGSLGYVYALLQIIGFAAGGVLIYSMLAAKLFCGKCSRYYSDIGTTTRYAADGDKFVEFFISIAPLLDAYKLSEVITLHSALGGYHKSNIHHVKCDVCLKFCKKCGVHYLLFDVMKVNGKNEWVRIEDLCVVRFTDAKLTLVS